MVPGDVIYAPFKSMQPLLRCRKLQVLKLTHHVPAETTALLCNHQLFIVSFRFSAMLQVQKLAHRIYMSQQKYHDALRVALRLNDHATIEQTFAACADVLGKRQLGYLLGRQGVALDLEEGAAAVQVGG